MGARALFKTNLQVLITVFEQKTVYLKHIGMRFERFSLADVCECSLNAMHYGGIGSCCFGGEKQFFFDNIKWYYFRANYKIIILTYMLILQL